MNDLTKRRLQLLALGYHIIPTYGKIAKLKGWNRPEFITRELDPERIEQWPLIYKKLKSTGVRIENGLRAVDVDVDDGPVVDALLDYIAVIAPDVGKRAPTRYGGGNYKLTLFVRAPKGDEVFASFPPVSYLRPGDPEDEDHKVELFGGGPARNGNCARHCGIYGPHSYNADGTVAVEYVWAEGAPALHEIALADLPTLSKAQMLDIAGEFERLAEAAGWVRVERPDTGSAGTVYDIDDSSRFNTDRAGHGLSYDELCEAQAINGDLRCSSSFIDGRHGSKTDRCWVYWSPRHDCVAVYEFGAERSHFPKTFAPKPDAVLAGIKLIQREGVRQSKKPDNDADLSDKSQWLIENYGYCALADSVIELFKPRADCALKPLAFNRLYRGWRTEEEGPKGGKKYAYATAYWEVNEQRVDIEGVRMRPDMPFPVYEEEGRKFKNTYQRPSHTREGDIAPFLAFMERFIPDRTEREWLFDWLAHKQLRPDIPGTAIVFVADDEDSIQEGEYGTGRGFFFRLVHRLYGEQYARAQTFSVMDGSSGQSQFTAWMHGSILVTVDESKTSSTAYRRGERSATYEILKDIVDPAPKRHEFKVKGGQAIDGMSYCSYMVATNHGDAVAIPEGDRRFTILSNGRAMNPVERSHMAAWLELEGSAGAVSAFLEQRNIAGFDMFWPLVTGGKTRMIDKARTDVENIMRGFMGDEAFPLAFTKRYMASMVEHNLEVKGAFWHGEFFKAWTSYCAKIRTANSGPKRLLVDGRQQEAFCFRGRRQKMEEMPNSLLSKNINQNPRIAEKQPLSNVRPLFPKV